MFNSSGIYRISSAANALGYKPYWLDLNSFKDTTGGKVINSQNDLYSFGSRISQKSKLFNRFVWEPVNYEGFKKITYNSTDQKNSELMTGIFKNIPKDIPVVATHVWPAQAAVHAGMERVVNAIPDNWPMALHLAEGSIHTVQTHSSLLGYRMLNGMDGRRILKPMPADSIMYTGHYIDHELVSNIDNDCAARIMRAKKKRPVRFLLTIGGAGAQREIFSAIISFLMPYIKAGKAVLYINVGDYKEAWDELTGNVSELNKEAVLHFDRWDDTKNFANEAKGYIKDMFSQTHMAKRTVLSFVGIFLMGFAISLFSLSNFGVDPYTSMNMNISSVVGMSFGTYQLIVNAVILLVALIVAHRGLIGVGTAFNMVLVGYTCDFFEKLLSPLVSGVFAQRIVLLVVAVVLMCFATSLFFTADIGVGAYDTVAFMITQRTKVPMKVTRVITDVSVVLIGLVVSGGLAAVFKGNFSEIKNIGIGTVITAFCTGPLVTFFNKHVSEKILNVDYGRVGKKLLASLSKKQG